MKAITKSLLLFTALIAMDVSAEPYRLMGEQDTLIGNAGGTTSSVNDLALDLSVDTVAADAGTGIYLREVSDGVAITVDTAATVSVDIDEVVRSDFNSGTTSVP